MSSRREGRDSDSKRHRSRFDQEPSPKRSRRDSRPETERSSTGHNVDRENKSDRDRHYRQQDAVPLEAPSAQDVKSERTVRKESENRTVKDNEGIKHSSDQTEGSRPRSSKLSSGPTEVPRSKSYAQHDERRTSGQVERSSTHKATNDQGRWKDTKEERNRTTTSGKQLDDENGKIPGKNDVWRHDRYSEVNADPKPLVRRRSFREEKVPVDTEKVEKASTDLVKPNPSVRPVLDGERKNDRAGHLSRHPDRFDRPFGGEREANRGEVWRGKFSSRERYNGNGNVNGNGSYRGGDRFSSRQVHRPGKVVEKWKHDLYDEANKSPSPKNEEDQIAKIEALLAS